MRPDVVSTKMLPIAILAGGIARRLRPITETIPKALVEVAGAPFIVQQLRLLKEHSFEKAVICAGYRGEMIEEVVGNGGAWGLDVTYSYDGPDLLGTGGALAKALPLLGGAFFVLYGDSYLECDYRDIQAAFFACGKMGLLTVFHNASVWDTSNIVYSAGSITAYDKKKMTSQMQYIDYGVSVLQKEAVAAAGFESESFDLADVYRRLVDRRRIAGYEVTRRFYEIGSHAGLEETRMYLECTRRNCRTGPPPLAGGDGGGG